MEHVNKRERLINIFQGVGMPTPIMLDQENTDLDSVMNQSSIQRSCKYKCSLYCCSFFTFIYLAALCVIIIIDSKNAFNNGYAVFALIMLSIFCISSIVSNIMQLNTFFNFLRVRSIDKKQFFKKLNELYNAKPKVTLSGEVFNNKYTYRYYENGLIRYRNKIINSINEDYSYNICKDNTDTIKLNSEFFKGKKFIVFYFQTEVTPGDPETTQDYEQKKVQFLKDLEI